MGFRPRASDQMVLWALLVTLALASIREGVTLDLRDLEQRLDVLGARVAKAAEEVVRTWYIVGGGQNLLGGWSGENQVLLDG